MTDDTDIESPDLLAAEYVLGTLARNEREEAEALLASDPNFERLVRYASSRHLNWSGDAVHFVLRNLAYVDGSVEAIVRLRHDDFDSVSQGIDSLLSFPFTSGECYCPALTQLSA